MGDSRNISISVLKFSTPRERADIADQENLRKLERVSQITASATDSVQVAAALQYITPV